MCDRGGFRVILNLKSFFQDHRERCFYYVDLNHHKSVRDVHRGIQERFNISNNIHLELKETLVPAYENVRILHEDDEIEVIDSGESTKCLERSFSCQTGIAVDEEEARKKKKKRKRKREKYSYEISLGGNDIHSNETESFCSPKHQLESTFSKEPNTVESFKEESQKKRKKRTKSSNEFIVCEGIHIRGNKQINDSTNLASESKVNGSVLLADQQEEELVTNVPKLEEVVCKIDGQVDQQVKKCVTTAPKLVEVVCNLDVQVDQQVGEYVTNVPKLEEAACKIDGQLDQVTNVPKLEEIACESGQLDRQIQKYLMSNTPKLEEVACRNGQSEASATSSNITSAAVLSKRIENEEMLVIKKEKSINQQRENGNGVKKRRRRRQKNKAKNENFHLEKTIEFVPSVHSYSSNKNSHNGPKHIKFTDDECDSICNSYVEEEIVSQNGVSCEVLPNSFPHSLNGTSDGISNTGQSPTSSKAVSENKVEKSFSVVQNNPVRTLSTNSSPLVFVCKRTTPSDSNCVSETNNRTDFTKYPKLKSTPQVNDIIAFKKWKMDDNYCPTVSDYISAYVQKISEDDGLLTLKVIDGHSELREPRGKFSLEMDPEDGSEPIIEKPVDIAHLNINELLDVRLVYP